MGGERAGSLLAQDDLAVKVADCAGEQADEILALDWSCAASFLREGVSPDYSPTRSASRGYRTTKPSESSSSSAVKSPSSAT